jgi:lipopolysaccharide biosynthesis glycosyltransferase
LVEARRPQKVFVGYDSREDIAWEVCRSSIERHASRAYEVNPLRQNVLRELGLYTRPADPSASTEFSLTRFLTPFVAAREDWTVFVDCDFLFTRDLTALFAGLDDSKAVYVVQHQYTPANQVKMDGKVQTVYPRKNWSSFMVFNGRHPAVKALTPDVVNTSTPAYLHRFAWIPDDSLIGALDLEWNFLVGEYPPPPQTPAALHYTNGGPWFEHWRDVDYADLWLKERALLHARAEDSAA